MTIRVYDTVNQELLAWIPLTSQRILDVGCGTGVLGQALKKRQKCQVVGITHNLSEQEISKNILDESYAWDLEKATWNQLKPFDCVVASHVLEHLRDPAALLRSLLTCMSPDAVLIVALPNVVHWRQRWLYLRGQFKYTPGGILDDDHVRFFDWESAQTLLESAGFSILKMKSTGNFPLPVVRPWLGPWARRMDALALRVWPGLWGDQFVFVCQRSRP